MDDQTLPQPEKGAGDAGTEASAGGALWITVLLVRIAALAAAVLLLQMSGTAAWDAHVLDLRGELRPATVLDVTQTKWLMPYRVTLAVAGVGPSAAVQVETRKDLDVGDRVEAIVDPQEPQRAALAGDGWPWGRVLGPLWGLLLVAVFGVRYGRWRKTEAARSHPDDDLQR
jgi:hypothetical protein